MTDKTVFLAKNIQTMSEVKKYIEALWNDEIVPSIFIDGLAFPLAHDMNWNDVEVNELV